MSIGLTFFQRSRSDFTFKSKIYIWREKNRRLAVGEPQITLCAKIFVVLMFLHAVPLTVRTMLPKIRKMTKLSAPMVG